MRRSSSGRARRFLEKSSETRVNNVDYVRYNIRRNDLKAIFFNVPKGGDRLEIVARNFINLSGCCFVVPDAGDRYRQTNQRFARFFFCLRSSLQGVVYE